MAAPSDPDRVAARVLVVEDSLAIREMVVEALVSAGYAADGRVDGDGIEQALDGYRPDLVILDVMLPGRDGFALADVVRQWGDAGLIMLTARDGLADRVRGLDGGADDYVVKPFEVPELVSRVGAVLRRRGRLPDTVQTGDLVVDRGAGIRGSCTPCAASATGCRPRPGESRHRDAVAAAPGRHRRAGVPCGAARRARRGHRRADLGPGPPGPQRPPAGRRRPRSTPWPGRARRRGSGPPRSTAEASARQSSPPTAPATAIRPSTPTP